MFEWRCCTPRMPAAAVAVLPTRHIWPVPSLHAATRFGLPGTWVMTSRHSVMILGPSALQTIPCSMRVSQYRSGEISHKRTSGPPGSTSGLPIIRAIAEYLPESDIPTTSPWDGFVLPARERTSRTIRTEQRNAHHLARAIFDRGRALVSVEVRLSEARGH